MYFFKSEPQNIFFSFVTANFIEFFFYYIWFIIRKKKLKILGHPMRKQEGVILHGTN